MDGSFAHAMATLRAHGGVAGWGGVMEEGVSVWARPSIATPNKEW
jgi:phage tail protein X